MAVGRLHDLGRIAGCGHGFLDKPAQAVERGGIGARIAAALDRSRFLRMRRRFGSSELVETHRDRLAEVHRRLLGIGGDLDQKMTEGQIVARQTVLFRTEDESGTAAAFKFVKQEWGQFPELERRLFGAAVSTGAGANYHCALPNRVAKRLGFVRGLEHFGCADGRARLAPVWCKGGDHRERGETEVGHGACGGSDVERIPWRDQYQVDAPALRSGEQGLIVEPVVSAQHAWGWYTRCTMVNPGQREPDPLAAEVDAICAAARWCHGKGWVPATSGNFSVRAGERILITKSGIDKGSLAPSDLLEVDLDGHPVTAASKPSAETRLHTVIYGDRPGLTAILHVHTLWNTLLSAHFAPHGYVPIEGYELLKGLSGVKTHAHRERVPILINSQDYETLARELAATLKAYPAAHGVLLSRHGLYTWGQSVAEARRHLEALEFLFEAEGRRLTSGVG